MGTRVTQEGYDPISNESKPITTTEDIFKEITAHPEWHDERWSKDVKLRPREFIGETQHTYRVNGGGADSDAYDVIPIEHVSSIMVRVFKQTSIDPITHKQIWAFSNDFDGKLSIDVDTIDGDVEATNNYPLSTVGGCGVKKIDPEWIYGVTLNITTDGSEDGTYLFQVFCEDSFDVDTELGNIDVHVDASEKAPLNVQPLEELVREDVMRYTGTFIGSIDNLFDKSVATSSVITIEPGDNVTLYLKKTFRIKEIKLLAVDGAFVVCGASGVNHTITITKPDGVTIVFNSLTDNYPFVLNDEISIITIANTDDRDNLIVAELIGELFLDRRVFAPEAYPVNVQQLGELVAEDIINAKGFPTDQDWRRLFDKNSGSLLLIYPNDNWQLTLKKPFRIKEIKVTSGAGTVIDDVTLVMTLTDIWGNLLAYPLINQPIVVNTEIIKIEITNTDVTAKNVNEIIAEMFVDNRVFAPETQPVNTQPLEELVAEDIIDVDITGDQDWRILFDKNYTTFVTIGQAETWDFWLKKPFRIKEFKVLNPGAEVVINNDLTLSLTDIFGNVTVIPLVAGALPYAVDAEIHHFRLQYADVVSEQEISEIIAELFLDRRVYTQGGQTASEAKPFNVKELGELVAEDISRAHLQGALEDLTRGEIESMFDKDRSTSYSLASASILILELKKYFNVDSIKLSVAGEVYSQIRVWCTDQSDHEMAFGRGEFTEVNEEISLIYIANDDESDPVIIQEVQVEAGAVNKPFTPESEPLNTEELGEIVSEDIYQMRLNQGGTITYYQNYIIRQMFLKKPPSTVLTLQPGDILEILFKKAFRLKQLSAFNVGHGAISAFTWSVYPADVETGWNNLTPDAYTGSVINVDDEVVRVDISNPITVPAQDITQLTFKKFLDRRVFMQGGQSGAESSPVNTQPLEELVWEDIISATGFEVGEDPSILFDKSMAIGITLAPADIWTFMFKKPFRIKELKLMKSDSTAVEDVLVDITTITIHGLTAYNCTSEPIVIEKELTGFIITNNSQNSYDISEIIAEIFLDRKAFAPEGEPLNTQPLEELVWEDIGYGYATPTDQDLEPPFDKKYDTYATLAVGTTWTFFLKKPFRLREIKVIDHATGLNLVDATVALTLTDVNGNPTVYYLSDDAQPIALNGEYVKIELAGGDTSYDIQHIMAELFLDRRVFAPETQPVNTQPLEEVVWEDLTSATGFAVGEEPRVLFDKQVNAPFIELSIGDSWVFTFKKPFRIRDLKIMTPASGEGTLLNPAAGDIIYITVTKVNGNAVQYLLKNSTYYTTPITINDEIVNLTIASDGSNLNAYNISEILAELFLDRRVFAPEKEPLNTQPLEELVFEDIYTAYLDAVLLTPDQIKIFFDKYIGIAFTLLAGEVLTFNLKKPFKLKRIFAVDGTGAILPQGVAPTIGYTTPLGVVGSAEGIVVADDYVRQITITNDTESSIPIYELIAEIYMSRQIFPQSTASFSVSAQEKAPVNVQPLEEVVWEDIMATTGFEEGEGPSVLFDKNYNTLLELSASAVWTFELKKPFRIKEVKIIDASTHEALVDEDIYFAYTDINGNITLVALADNAQPIAIDKEIHNFSLNNTGQNNPTVAEIVLEMFLDRRVSPQNATGMPVSAAEKTPVNTQPLEELVWEDIISATGFEVGEDPSALFDKNMDTAITLAPADIWTLALKKPFRVKELKILLDTYTAIDDALVTVTTTDIHANPTVYPCLGQPIVINDEIVSIVVTNGSQVSYDVSEIIAELFLDRKVFAPESQPLNTQPLEELVWEDITSITGLTAGQNAKVLFDKSLSVAFVLGHGQVIAFSLKKSFRMKELKVLGSDGSIILNPTLGIEIYTAFGANQVAYTGDQQPIRIEQEISSFVIRNTSEDTDLNIYEIVIELFYDTRVFAPEAEPLNVQSLGEIVFEDIMTVTGIAPEYPRKLFDKHVDATFYLTLAFGTTWSFALKKPFRVKDIKILGTNGAVIVNDTVNLTITDILGNPTVVPLVAGALPYIADTEIISFSLANTDDDTNQDIRQIIIETFQDVRQHIQLDGRTFFQYDNGETNGETPLAVAYAVPPYDWVFLSQSFDLKNDEATGGAIIYWSWDSINDKGFLNPGEIWHEQCHKRGIWLRASAVDALYRLWAR